MTNDPATPAPPMARAAQRSNWFDGPRPRGDEINQVMTKASDAFNAAYHESRTTAQLHRNVTACIEALHRVQQLTAPRRGSHQRESPAGGLTGPSA